MLLACNLFNYVFKLEILQTEMELMSQHKGHFLSVKTHNITTGIDNI